MSRIRSIYSGLFTDKDYNMVSPTAVLFLIGLLTEADDNGVFEWEPISLKMKIWPGRNLDAEPFLKELSARDIIRNFSIDGRSYGAIRNFRKYQKPRHPTYVHPIPTDLRRYTYLEQALAAKTGVKDD